MKACFRNVSWQQPLKPNSQLTPEADEKSSDSEETPKKPAAINLIRGSIFDFDWNEEYPEA